MCVFNCFVSSAYYNYYQLISCIVTLWLIGDQWRSLRIVAPSVAHNAATASHTHSQDHTKESKWSQHAYRNLKRLLWNFYKKKGKDT